MGFTEWEKIDRGTGTLSGGLSISDKSPCPSVCVPFST